MARAERAQRVEVLHLTARPELGCAASAHRDVGVDAQRALLHPAVRRAGGDEDRPQLVDVAAGLLGAADVGLRDDLDERHAGAVVVDERVVGAVDPAAPADVGRLAGVLFDVGADDSDDRAVGQLDSTADVDRLVVLADLVVLRHVGIEVVLPVEHRRRDARPERHADAHRELDGAAR